MSDEVLTYERADGACEEGMCAYEVRCAMHRELRR